MGLGHYLVRHGQLPLQIRFVIPEYLAIFIFKISVQILGRVVLIRVDDLSYSFLGNTLLSLYNGMVNFISIAITPMQTVVITQAGPMQVNFTFLNPIEVCFHSSVTFMSTYASS